MSNMQDKISNLISANLDSIDRLKGKKVLSITVGQVKKQNALSNRSGTSISIKYIDHKEIKTQSIWAKFLDLPQAAYEAQKRIYAKAEEQGIAAPIPKPYFFDTYNNVLIMEMKAGTNLLKPTLHYAFVLNILRAEELRDLFFEIGCWLGRFHVSVELSQRTSLFVVIEKVKSELLRRSHFGRAENRILLRNLDRLSEASFVKHNFNCVTPHNDFTLRNLFMRHDGGFNIVDWDAMIHPCFPQEDLGWRDLSMLIINMQSMLKLSPIIRARRIENLCNTLLDGYFSKIAIPGSIDANELWRCAFYVYTLKYWLGTGFDRPLWKVYGASRGMGNRYVAKLRRRLLEGHADLCSR